MDAQATLRAFEPKDLDSLYAISLATADRGQDASAQYADGRLMGHIYSGPYAALRPDLCFVAEDAQGVAGFVIGAVDTVAYERELERFWWPHLRAQYADPGPERMPDWPIETVRRWTIHHPRPTPPSITGPFPAHLHMNLLPRLQGQGIGVAMLNHWLGVARVNGVSAVHVGANAGNPRAIRFWQRCGFTRLPDPPPMADGLPVWTGPVWLGRDHLRPVV